MSSWTEGSLGGNGLTVVRAVGIVAPWHDRPRSTDTPRVSRTRVSPLSPSYRIGELASAWSSMSGREVTPSSWAFVAIGVVVRVRDYAYDRALWLDESLLSLTIIDLTGFGESFHELSLNQAASRGFLLVECCSFRSQRVRTPAVPDCLRYRVPAAHRHGLLEASLRGVLGIQAHLSSVRLQAFTAVVQHSRCRPGRGNPEIGAARSVDSSD